MKKHRIRAIAAAVVAAVVLLSFVGCIDTAVLSELAGKLAETQESSDTPVSPAPEPAHGIVRISVNFHPPLSISNGDDHKVFKSSKKINAVMDAIGSLELKEDTSGLLGTVDGSTLTITATDMHGEEYTYTLVGNRAFSIGNTAPKEITYEQATALEKLIAENRSDTEEPNLSSSVSVLDKYEKIAKDKVSREFGIESDCLVVTESLAVLDSVPEHMTASVEMKLVFAKVYDPNIVITVNVFSSGEATVTKADYRVQEYAAFSKYATEAAFEAATAKMKSPRNDPAEYYLEKDSDGYLCVCYEQIVDIDPPVSNEWGESSGCGIDHDHVFESQRVCALPTVKPIIN